MFNREPSSNMQGRMRVLEVRGRSQAFNQTNNREGEVFQIWDSENESREGSWRREKGNTTRNSKSSNTQNCREKYEKASKKDLFMHKRMSELWSRKVRQERFSQLREIQRQKYLTISRRPKLQRELLGILDAAY